MGPRADESSNGMVTIWTVGHGTRPIDVFIALLQRAGIRRLIDVRVAPGSRRNPQFGQEALAEALANTGIFYTWEKELGGFRKPRPDSPHTALRNATFQGYADHMDTPEFHEALARLVETSAETPTVIMCAESVWWRCHRRMIADALVAEGYSVIHLMDSGDREHTLHPNARIVEGRPVYDLGSQPSLV
jgi:uncharacterized protein (DUF488 family)